MALQDTINQAVDKVKDYANQYTGQQQTAQDVNQNPQPAQDTQPVQNTQPAQNTQPVQNNSLITGTNADVGALKTALTGMTNGNLTGTVDANMIQSLWTPEGADAQYLPGYYDKLQKQYGGYTPQQMYQYLYSTAATGGLPQFLTGLQNGYTDYVAAQKAAEEKAIEDAKLQADRDASKQTVLDQYLKSYADDINKRYRTEQEQIAANIDYQTALKQRQARYAYEDALADYQRKYRNYTAQAMNGVDNSLLASRASGRFGGTATANAAAVQNQYQQARQELALQQQQLATDTMREVERLRSEGEFDKADQLLKSRQAQFQALYEEGIRVDENQYNNYVQQNTWDRDDERIQREEEREQKQWMQQLGMQAMQVGLMPNEEMLKAMGIDMATAQLYINAVKAGL